jgi:uncharacterized protein YukE
MTFSVDPRALRVLADQLRDVHRDADAAGKYMHRYSDIGTHGSGVLGQVLGSHADLVGQLDRMIARLGELTDASGTALRQVADRYEDTDRDSAAKLDATYPVVPRPSRPFD